MDWAGRNSNPRSTTLERLRKLLQLVMQCGCVESICARFCICISITYFFNEYSSSVGWARYSLCLQCELTHFSWGPRVAQWVRSLDLIAHTNLSPIRRGLAPGFVDYKKGCTRLAAASNKAYQLLVHGRWFSPGTPVSSTTKTGRHDIAEILLKVALKHQKTKNLNHFSWKLQYKVWQSIKDYCFYM